MDELVYLSTAKLRSFTERPGRLAIKGAEGKLKLFGLEGTITAASSEQDPRQSAYRKLLKVQDGLLRSSRWLRWYEDEDIDAGDWVQFEAKLGWRVFGGIETSVVIFAPPRRSTGQTLLVLHGSPSSLTDAYAIEPSKESGSSASGMARFLAEMGRRTEPDLPNLAAGDRLLAGALDTIEELQNTTIGFPYLDGWARATACLPISSVGNSDRSATRLLLASPLYVRYAIRDEIQDSGR